MQEECVNAFLFTFLVDIRDVRVLFFFLRDSIVWGGVVCFLMESANMDSKLKFVLSQTHHPACPFSPAGTGVCESRFSSQAASGTTLGMANLINTNKQKQPPGVDSLSHISNLLNLRFLLC